MIDNIEKISPHRKYPPEIYEKIYKWDIENNPGGVFGRIYLRKWSVLIVRLLAPLPVTPNLLTSMAIVFSLFALLVLYLNIPFSNIWAVIFIQICLVLGYADGDMVRLKKLGNKFGGWFDGAADMIKVNVIYFALAVAAYLQKGSSDVFFYLALLISTRLILAHIAQKTSYTFVNEETSLNDVVTGGMQNKLGNILHLDPSFLTFSDDIKFFLISLFVLTKQFLPGIYFLIALHSFLILFAFVNVWRIGRKEAPSDIGWKK